MSSNSIDNSAAPVPHVGFPTDPTDRSLEIGIAIRSAKAVADLLYTACGDFNDGSDSKIDELGSDTLRDAVACIFGQLQLAVDLEKAESKARIIRNRESAHG